MPIYGYRCTQCGHELEILQSISDAPLRECPVCMGPLQKMLYPVGVIYKGSGFYTTDYKGGSRSEASSDGTGKSDSSGKSESSGGGEKASDKAAS